MHPRLRRAARNLLILTLLAAAAASAGAWYLQSAGVAPRALAMYLQRRAEGHRPLVADSVGWVADALTALDRGSVAPLALPALTIGAQPQGPVAPAGREVLVGTSAEVRTAIEQARPGDVLILLPGRYRFSQTLALAQSGGPDSKITLRARSPDSVFLEFAAVQGFVVTGQDWRVENLTIRGTCASQPDCEHAFHVVGGAQRFAALNNSISDFNAHFKINGEQGRFPDDGLIEGNTLTNGSARQTSSAVTPIDMVGVNRWTVRRNLISDFVKAGGDRISYGAFAKGAGTGNVFERNMVLCEARLRGFPGQRVGLSLGGGGTGKEFCRDHKCITEQDQGVIQANLVAACSDVGIYLNSASGSRVLHNTLIDTAGIDLRYAETVAEVSGNLVDGAIRVRNDAVLHASNNAATATSALYIGYHPVRNLFASAVALDLDWSGTPRRGQSGATETPDLCGGRRPTTASLGAFEHFSACRRAAGVR